MTAPTVAALTQRLYDELPEVYRDADVDDGTPNGRPLLRFLSLIGDQASAVADLIDRIDPDEHTSALADPATADAAWLPWRAQLVGVTLNPALSTAAARLAVAGAVSGWQAGTRDTIAAAAKSALTSPTGYVSIRANYNGDPFTVGVAVDPNTAPVDLNTVLAAIDAAHARPAGIRIIIDTYAATWDTLETRLDTWAGVEARGSWAAVETTQP